MQWWVGEHQPPHSRGQAVTGGLQPTTSGLVPRAKTPGCSQISWLLCSHSIKLLTLIISAFPHSPDTCGNTRYCAHRQGLTWRTSLCWGERCVFFHERCMKRQRIPVPSSVAVSVCLCRPWPLKKMTCRQWTLPNSTWSRTCLCWRTWMKRLCCTTWGSATATGWSM